MNNKATTLTMTMVMTQKKNKKKGQSVAINNNKHDHDGADSHCGERQQLNAAADPRNPLSSTLSKLQMLSEMKE
jgi:hypothetical protein